MQISQAAMAKVDSGLRAAIERAAPEEKLRLVMTLRVPAVDGDQMIDHAPARTRAEFRQAKIAKATAGVCGVVDTVKQQLRAFELAAQGGDLIPVLVVEGPAGALMKALELNAVGAASLDHEIHLIAPRY